MTYRSSSRTKKQGVHTCQAVDSFASALILARSIEEIGTLLSRHCEECARAFHSRSGSRGTRQRPTLGRAGAGPVAVRDLRHAEDGVVPRATGPTYYELAEARGRELVNTQTLAASVRRLEQAEQLQRALFAIADMAGSDRSMPRMLRDLHKLMCQLMYAENFYIALYNQANDTVRFLYFADTVETQPIAKADEIPMDSLFQGLTWYLIRDAKPLMGSTEQLRRQVSGPLRVVGADSLAWLGVPMMRRGKAVGALVVQSYVEADCYSEAERALLSFIADHVLTALERKQSQQELEARVEDRTRALADANADLQRQIVERERAEHLQSTLYRIAALSTSEESATDFYRLIHQAVAEVVNSDNFYIALLSADRTCLEFPYYVDALFDRQPSRPLARGLSEYVIRHARPTLLDREGAEALAAAGEIDAAIALAGLPPQSWLGVPLAFNDAVIGLVAVQSYREEHRYDQGDQEVLTFVAHQIARSLERRQHALSLRRWNVELEERVQQRTVELSEQIAVREQMEAELKHQVMHDALTGLPNRIYVRDRLERALAEQHRRPERGFALLYLDIDRFKLFNDSLGHLAGDEVLRQVAQRLRRCVRAPDVVARLSGDEFCIFLEQSPQTACRVAQRIHEEFLTPMLVAGRELLVSASIGIAVSSARHHSSDDLFHDADVALYRAKGAGRQRFVMFDDALHRDAMDVLEMEHSLRAALARHEFVPYFQPLVSLRSADVIGYETLVRWRHPTRGILAPGAFLPTAEQCGLIEDVDWAVYRLAMAQARGFLRTGQYITLNASPRHFQNDEFDGRFIRLIGEIGIHPTQVRIEVTEGMLLADPEAAYRVLTRLREAGVETALDDFGTGYSSLSYINRFPLRMIKIDRSFVTPLGAEGAQRSSAIIAAILALAQALDLDVLAEGVESAAQQEALIAMGCHFAQGFLFGKPAPMNIER